MGLVVCLGEILIDRIARQAGDDVGLIQDWTDYPGGAPANVACALRRLGTPSAFLGAIGSDAVGDRLLLTLRQSQVLTASVQRISTAPTREVYVTRTAEGDRKFAGFSNAKQSGFADECLIYHPSDQRLFQGCEYLYLGSLILAPDTARAAVDEYLKLAHAHDVQCFMDINWRPMFWHNPDEAKAIILERLGLMNYLKMSEEEAQWLFQTDDPDLIGDVLPHLDGIFVTQGASGCRYRLQEFSGDCPGFPVEALDTTGAGDGFVAGCLHQLATDMPLNHPRDADDFIRYANAVGALTTLHLGAIATHPTDADVTLLLNQSRV